MTFAQIIHRAKNHSRTQLLAEMKQMQKAIKGSIIKHSPETHQLNTAWLDYQLIDKKGKVLSKLESVYHGLGGTNDFLTFD